MDALEPLIRSGEALLAIVLGATLAFRWRRRRTRRTTRALSTVAAIVAGLLALLVWSKRVEPRFVEVTHETLRLSERPFRLAVLADLHAGRADEPMLRNAVRLANDEHADVILLAGDYISGYELIDDRRAKLQGLRGLAAKRGVFAVLGNHDSEPYGDDTPRRASIAKELESFGYRVLRNEAIELAPDLWLAGVDEVQAGLSDAPLAFAKVPEKAHRIALAHDWHALDADVRFDLGLVGHTHGGQVCVPFTQLCGSPARNQPYVRGRHTWKPGGVLYVNRGIGLSKLPVRLACRPEITVFDL